MAESTRGSEVGPPDGPTEVSSPRSIDEPEMELQAGVSSTLEWNERRESCESAISMASSWMGEGMR